eukprot:712756-Amphidinium_carterae.1
MVKHLVCLCTLCATFGIAQETDLLVTLLIYCTRSDIRARMKCQPEQQCHERLDTLAGRIGRVETPEDL